MKKLTSKKLRAELLQTKFYLEKAHFTQDATTAFRLHARLIAQEQVLLSAKGKTYDEFYNEVRRLRHTNQKRLAQTNLPLDQARYKLIENTLQEILVQL